MNTKHIYRYIWKIKGRYRIVKNNKSYGSFTKLENALLERDILEDYNWDENILTNIETITKNRYLEMDLPPFKKQTKQKLPKYIRKRGKGYLIQKSINGQTVHFGTYNTLKEASYIRMLLEDNNWNKDIIENLARFTWYKNTSLTKNHEKDKYKL